MITPSYSPTATERVLPAMMLDFLKGTLDPRVSVSRAANTATRVNSSGLIEIVNADQPRFNYDPITLEPKGLLVESARTNLALYSQDFSNASWTTSASELTVSADASVSPDGTQNADALVETSANNYHFLAQSFSKASSAIQYTFSCYVKPSTRQWFFITVYDGGVTANRLWFNLSGNGAIGSNVIVGAGFSNVAYSIEKAANGFYRCIVTFTTTNTAALFVFPSLSTGNSIETYAGTNGATGAFIWGAQLEQGAFPTSYIPTTSTSVLRNPDVVAMSGTNFSDWYNVGAGSWYIQTNARSGDTILTAGTFTLTADATALKKYANSYSTNQSASSLVVGDGTVAKLAYYKQALLAAELQALRA